MKKILLFILPLLLLFVSCEDKKEEPLPLDCAGVEGGTAEEDICGVCNGDGTSCYGCTDATACNFNSDATIFDNSCIYELDCNGECGTAVVDCSGVCGGDADESECINGTYTLTTAIFYNNSECSGQGADIGTDFSGQLILNSDGSATMTLTQGDDEILLQQTGSWTESGNLVIITYDDDDNTETYTFTDNSLISQQATENSCIYLVFTKN